MSWSLVDTNVESRTQRPALLDMSDFLFVGGVECGVKQLNVAMTIGG